MVMPGSVLNDGESIQYSDSLVVCEAERGEVGVFLRKVCQSVNDSGQLEQRRQRVLVHGYCIIHSV